MQVLAFLSVSGSLISVHTLLMAWEGARDSLSSGTRISLWGEPSPGCWLLSSPALATVANGGANQRVRHSHSLTRSFSFRQIQANIFLIYLKLLNLFERELSLMHWLTLQSWDSWKPRAWELRLGLPCVGQGPRYLSRRLLPPTVPVSRNLGSGAALRLEPRCLSMGCRHLKFSSLLSGFPCNLRWLSPACPWW